MNIEDLFSNREIEVLQWLKVLNNFTDENCPDDTFGDKLEKFVVEHVAVKKNEEILYYLDTEEFYIVILKMLKFGFIEMYEDTVVLSEGGQQLFNELPICEDTELEVADTIVKNSNKFIDVSKIVEYAYKTMDIAYKAGKIAEMLNLLNA